MINWKTFAVVTGTLMILPLGSYAAQSNWETANIQEQNNMGRLAQGIKHGRKGDRAQKMERLLQQLDLTPEQSQQIDAIREESEATAQNLRQQMKAQREQMPNLLASDEDAEQIRAQYQQGQGLRQQLSDNRLETMLQIREVLTTEQRAEVAELMEQHRERKSSFFSR